MSVWTWRWVFSSSSLSSYSSTAVQQLFHALFPLLFPYDCRVCGQPLPYPSRSPLCLECLRPPKPFAAEFFCASCGTPFESGFPLDEEGRCALCRHGLRGFDAAYCYGSYEGLLREWIHLFHGRVKTMARSLDLLAAVLRRHERLDCVVPVPLHWRRRERGFNQAELLAWGIARKWHIPVLPTLRRVRHTPTRTSLSNTARPKNVTAAFASRRTLAAQRVRLIDDVLTTGATAAVCATALRRSGAARVVVLTAARADRRMAIRITSDVNSEETSNHG